MENNPPTLTPITPRTFFTDYGENFGWFAHCPPCVRSIFARGMRVCRRWSRVGGAGKTAFHLRPLTQCLAAELKTSEHLGVDETPVRVLDPGAGQDQDGLPVGNGAR